MQKTRVCLFTCALLVLAPLCAAETLQERLGYSADNKLLIVHADDLGVSHSTNRAFIEAYEQGVVNSGSIMVPTPWFPEIAEFARQNPEVDLGLHLTLTAEWKHLKWGPVLPAEQVPSLVDDRGFLPADTPIVVAQADPEDVRKELRAQVERALEFGIRPTHLDSHMGVLFVNRELLQVLLDVASEFRLPVLIPSRLKGQAWLEEVELGSNQLWIDSVSMATPAVKAEQWSSFYAEILEQMEPGVHEIIIHLAFDDPEMQAVTIDHPDYGSAWRQRDFDVFTAKATESLLERKGIEPVTWAAIRALME